VACHNLDSSDLSGGCKCCSNGELAKCLICKSEFVFLDCSCPRLALLANSGQSNGDVIVNGPDRLVYPVDVLGNKFLFFDDSGIHVGLGRDSGHHHFFYVDVTHRHPVV